MEGHKNWIPAPWCRHQPVVRSKVPHLQNEGMCCNDYISQTKNHLVSYDLRDRRQTGRCSLEATVAEVPGHGHAPCTVKQNMTTVLAE